ncbi:uncharacterized protein AMSG_10511 [Thecamonas trahens ATCC 50062]|uniref:Uncharacterized protein n=1 Tax=Thecamonas trahens ATCC 50062 TaxID=461836 RepID=A0A0L0DQD2_THETB|nr:hypothetical protein AMSG_10511 [Thecamonas trahens ATCC 50062]KNC54512.1 hypothetical protein AMSG_10511 [Thecamonas trahens ATCC 50062]|eukprot:XP_013753665.1 hypothetical protein AMSG_10511 [Thecamonas trahens ATCC 50062]
MSRQAAAKRLSGQQVPPAPALLEQRLHAVKGELAAAFAAAATSAISATERARVASALARLPDSVADVVADRYARTASLASSMDAVPAAGAPVDGPLSASDPPPLRAHRLRSAAAEDRLLARINIILDNFVEDVVRAGFVSTAAKSVEAESTGGSWYDRNAAEVSAVLASTGAGGRSSADVHDGDAEHAGTSGDSGESERGGPGEAGMRMEDVGAMAASLESAQAENRELLREIDVLQGHLLRRNKLLADQRKAYLKDVAVLRDQLLRATGDESYAPKSHGSFMDMETFEKLLATGITSKDQQQVLNDMRAELVQEKRHVQQVYLMEKRKLTNMLARERAAMEAECAAVVQQQAVELEDTIADLRDQVASTTDQLETVEARFREQLRINDANHFEELKALREHYEGEVHIAGADARARLDEAEESFRIRLADMRQEFRKARAAHAAELAEKTDTIRMVQAKLARADARLATYDSQVGDATASAMATQHKLDALNVQLDLQKDMLRDANDHADALQLDAARAALLTEDALANTARQLTAARAEIARLAALATGPPQPSAADADASAAIVAKMHNLRERLVIAASANAELEARLADAEARADSEIHAAAARASAADASNAREELYLARAQTAALREAYDTATAAAADNASRIAALEADLAAERKRADELAVAVEGKVRVIVRNVPAQADAAEVSPPSAEVSTPPPAASAASPPAETPPTRSVSFAAPAAEAALREAEGPVWVPAAMPEAVIAEASREMAATIEGEVAMSEEARAALLRTTQKVFDRLFAENKTIEARLSVKRALIQEEEQARREAVMAASHMLTPAAEDAYAAGQARPIGSPVRGVAPAWLVDSEARASPMSLAGRRQALRTMRAPPSAPTFPTPVQYERRAFRVRPTTSSGLRMSLVPTGEAVDDADVTVAYVTMGEPSATEVHVPAGALRPSTAASPPRAYRSQVSRRRQALLRELYEEEQALGL